MVSMKVDTNILCASKAAVLLTGLLRVEAGVCPSGPDALAVPVCLE